MYRACSGRFGTIPHVCSYGVVGERREVVSNILFLPRDGDITNHHWPIFSDDPPETPELRTLWVCVFAVEGRSLVEATSPRQLSRAWVHFLLGVSVGTPWCNPQLMRAPTGWLSTYLSGYMHGDISIKNVLMVDKPVKQKVFSVPKSFRDDIPLIEDMSLGGGYPGAV